MIMTFCYFIILDIILASKSLTEVSQKNLRMFQCQGHGEPMMHFMCIKEHMGRTTNVEQKF